jgi:hypothetical protein
LAVLITGALSQVEATIELATRVYDSVFPPANQELTLREMSYGAAEVTVSD